MTQRTKHLNIALAMIIFSLLGGCTEAQVPEAAHNDDPTLFQLAEWKMEGYNPQRTRATPDQALPPLNINQEVKIGASSQFGSPVSIANGLLFLEGRHKLYALSLDQGHERWSFDLSGSYLSPAIVDGQVFVRAEAGESGSIFALTADAGLKLWQYKFPRVGSADGNLGGHVTSPVVVEGLVVVGAARTFRALEATTGEIIWTFSTAEPISSSASIADDTVYFTDFETLYALDLQTGAERWRFTQGGLSVVFAPVIIEQQILTANQDTAYVLDRDTGELLWQKTVVNERLIPAGAMQNKIYVKSVNRIYALDRLTGEERWLFQVNDFISLPTITDGLIYVITRTGGSSQLRAIDAASGKEVWQSENARLANTAPVVAGGRVYVRTTDGSILVYN